MKINIIVSLLFFSSCTNDHKLKEVKSDEILETLTQAETNAKDTGHLIWGHRFEIYGNFNGQGEVDTIQEVYFDDHLQQEVAKYHSKDSTFDLKVSRAIRITPTAILHGSKEIKDFNIIKGSQIFGVYALQNEGDLTGNGRDEISYIIDYADWSNINTCHIAAYTDTGWSHIASFEIREFDIMPPHDQLRTYSLFGTADVEVEDSIQEGYATPEYRYNLITKIQNGLISVKTYNMGDNITKQIEFK